MMTNHCGLGVFPSTSTFASPSLPAGVMPVPWIPMPPSKEEIVDQIGVMRQQEETIYAYQTYLPRSWSKVNGQTVETRLNIAWREKICQWSYNVIDHFDLSREVVALSLCLFDRYLATRGNQCNGNLALLTSLTTLHIAIKLYDSSRKIKIGMLANLSRGQFTARHIEEMEWMIIAALGFHLHPPTQFAFVYQLSMLLPIEAHPIVRKELIDLSRYYTELAICDSFFVGVPSSTVAFASILNVMEDMSYAQLSAGVRVKFVRDIALYAGLQYHNTEVVAARERLRSMWSSSGSKNKTGVEAFGVPSDKNGTDNGNDGASIAGGSTVSSSPGSIGSRTQRAMALPSSNYRLRANSADSMGSCRKIGSESSIMTTNHLGSKPSPQQAPHLCQSRRLVPGVSPMNGMIASRAHHALSPTVAGLQ